MMVTPAALGQQHGDDLLGRAVAEQLAELLLVVGDAMLADGLEEVLRREARQRRAAEMRVVGKVVFWTSVQVGEIAASAS